MVDKLVFISEVRNPRTNATSTQIMTNNLLYGFGQIAKKTIFVAINANSSDYESITSVYSTMCDHLVIVKDLTNYRNRPILSKLSMIFACLRSFKTMIPKELLPFLDNKTTVVSHSPSIDSALIARAIKKQFEVDYVQYWGDPLSLSLITPEQYSIKRSVQKCVESFLHESADRIVFGTKSLYDAQIKLFPRIISKAFPVGVSYRYFPNKHDCQKHPKMLIGYFGNYYSRIRDICPFYNAAREIENANFVICGSGDVELQPSKNVNIMKRMSINDVVSYENNLDVIVCLLNKVGIQIPGKIFYQTNTNKEILVILDGPNKQAIFNELNEYDRFIFCDNNKESITETLLKIVDGDFKKFNGEAQNSPQKIAKDILGI